MRISRINNNYPLGVIQKNNNNASRSERSEVSFKGLGSGPVAHKLADSNFMKWLLPAANKNTLAIEALYALFITCMLRPAVTLMTPAKSEEDKDKNKFRAAHAIASGVLGFAFTMCVSHPMSDAVDKVMKTKLPDGSFKYIKKYTEQLTENGGKPFKELAKRLHQPGFMPIRGMLTVAIVPPILAALGLSKDKKKQEQKPLNPVDVNPSFNASSTVSNKLLASQTEKGGVQ